MSFNIEGRNIQGHGLSMGKKQNAATAMAARQGAAGRKIAIGWFPLARNCAKLPQSLPARGPISRLRFINTRCSMATGPTGGANDRSILASLDRRAGLQDVP